MFASKNKTETTWRYKPRLLSEKNQHGVPYQKIKDTLDQFERVNDLDALIKSCKRDLESGTGIKSSTPTNNSSARLQSFHNQQPPAVKSPPKSGHFLGNTANYLKLDSLDWTQFSSDPQETSISSLASISGASKSIAMFQSENPKPSLNKPEPEVSKPKGDRVIAEIIQSKDLLQQMFPHVKEDILIEFLTKYENDVDMVTNLLLDSLNLSEEEEEVPANNDVICNKRNESSNQVPSTYYNPPLLKTLCEKAMEKLDSMLETHYKSSDCKYEKSKNTDAYLGVNFDSICNSSSRSSSISSKSNSKFEDITSNGTSNSTCSSKDYKTNGLYDNENDDEDEGPIDNSYDPILELKLDKRFLGYLINLFGEKEDEIYLNEGIALVCK
jgi:hypothetical protein